MFLTLLTLFLDTFDTAQALLSTYPHPRETTIQEDVSGLNSGWSPRPTSPPDFYPWLGAAKQGELLVRLDVKPATCGWLTGDKKKPLECGTDVCAYYNSYDIKGFVCCPTSASGTKIAGSCPYRSACLDFGQTVHPYWGSFSNIASDGPVLSCSIQEPFCYTIANSDSAGGSTWHFFGCDVAPGFYSAAMTTTLGEPYFTLSGPTSRPSIRQPSSSVASPPSNPDDAQQSNAESVLSFDQPISETAQNSPSENGPGLVTQGLV